MREEFLNGDKRLLGRFVLILAAGIVYTGACGRGSSAPDSAGGSEAMGGDAGASGRANPPAGNGADSAGTTGGMEAGSGSTGMAGESGSPPSATCLPTGRPCPDPLPGPDGGLIGCCAGLTCCQDPVSGSLSCCARSGTGGSSGAGGSPGASCVRNAESDSVCALNHKPPHAYYQCPTTVPDGCVLLIGPDRPDQVCCP